MIFLGILLDQVSHNLVIPVDKKLEAMKLLRFVMERKKVKVKIIQKLTGYRNSIRLRQSFLVNFAEKNAGIKDNLGQKCTNNSVMCNEVITQKYRSERLKIKD